MYKPEFEGKTILVTGGTGSIGSQIVRHLLTFRPKQIRVYSRDDSKQFYLLKRLDDDHRLRMLLGDVRDEKRLMQAMEGVDIVFHCAALKHVIGTENNPHEAVKTNILGTQNVIEACLAHGVEKMVGISTDKAADPTSVLGCTKLLSEKLVTTSALYKGAKKTEFCFVRFGNVIGTRGSVIPLFIRQVKHGGPVTLTDPEMLRFFMSVDDAVRLIFKATRLMCGREIFILKMPVIRIGDLARAVIDQYASRYGRTPEDISTTLIGRQIGERVYEKLLGREECQNALELEDMFVIGPHVDPRYDVAIRPTDYPNAKPVERKEYTTETQIESLLTPDGIRELLAESEDYINEALW
ncbi:MAG: polysaccharide biosynthesis protein [Candidatus Uhrbacteria bacterium]|nr:polysaccharide biosynthesis protein [Candidatus Uhrbacteria bacterium]